MVQSATDSLPLLLVNAKRLRSIYAWLSVAGGVGSGLLGAYFISGAKIEGPSIAAAVFFPGILAVCLAQLLWQRRQDAKVLRLLIDEPQLIARVFPKRTESAVYGATVARYSWIVLELANGSRSSVYSSADDFEGVLREIRRCAPNAQYDGAWVTERTNVHIR